ncbi:hypothetical protein IWW38_004335 [Coemansia aciculifera]|uniref:Uncharacterized protein n=1 Tax=Coemansia aciculifera TaxID=417176 RepID=A0ACC1LYK2_9FUNG|nr:hypothetical protein IWW38_004335 [Coemansia aciculifera]
MAEELPSALGTKHFPLSRNFKRLNILAKENRGSGDDDNEFEFNRAVDIDNVAKTTAYAAMKLAAICPNFAHVDLSKKFCAEFSQEIVMAMKDPAFLPYADSISRLVYQQ